MRIRFTLFILSIFSLQAFATHNRAGEITYKHKTGYTYEFTITTYTKDSAPADRCELTIDFGDGSTAVFIRSNGSAGSCPSPAKMGSVVPGVSDIRVNIYKGEHSYQAPGYYTVSVQDLNRNDGISNIPSSVLVPFFITSTVLIDPSLGGNSSPELTYPPVDQGCTFKKFIHNPGAFDPDGDSLSYELIDCRGLGGVTIPETYSPLFVQDPVTIDSVTGDFLWNVPKNIGQFNFAILIREYRKAVNGTWQLLGTVTRDFQVDIDGCSNNPPVIAPLGPYCVEAGQNLTFEVVATDIDNDNITLTASGGPFEVNPAPSFPQPTTGKGTVKQTFIWGTTCDFVRKQPYYAQFRAQDNPANPNFPSLTDLMSVEITVVAPAPQNPTANPLNSVINVGWDPEVCTDAVGYKLYRKEGPSGFVPANCELGIPSSTGYVYHATLLGINNTNYTDSINLKNGVQYCYMVYAYFPDAAESYASAEICTELPKALPIITHVDIISTDANTGEVEVKWVAPKEIDTISFPPPYTYVLERADQIDGSNFTQIASMPSLTDTFYADNNLNTSDLGYSYKVGFLSNNVLIAYSDPASSVYLDIFPSDEQNTLRFNFSTPWENDTILVYKETSPGSNVFDSIGLTTNKIYIDTGLVNGDEYCYKGRAIGRYSGTGLPTPLINNSQIDCAIPLDTTKPCAPVLTHTAVCEQGLLDLFWTDPVGPFCASDIVSYNIYYKLHEIDPWQLIANVPYPTNSINLDSASIVGCYAVTALDDAVVPNESKLSNVICIEGCPFIELPNVFTPNGSGQNDLYLPLEIKDIDQFKIEIFNRWGGLVYISESKEDFTSNGWDGTSYTSNSDCADGVYYYLVSYTAKTTRDPKEEYIKGFIHLFR